MFKMNKAKPIRFDHEQEKKIQEFANEHFRGNFNEAVRMLCKTSLTNR